MALLIASFSVWSQVRLVDELTPDPRSPMYPVPGQQAEVLLNAHDGQFFAAVAADPLLDHPDTIGPEVAQRASRPLWSWLAWLSAFGDDRRIANALMALTALSIAGLVAAVMYLAEGVKRDGGSALVLFVLASPGVIALIAFPGLNDAMGASLALVGLGAWKRGRRKLALGAFAAAGLCHEALLMFPLAVAVEEMVENTRETRSRLTPAGWLLAIVPYVVWVGCVRLRVGDWPTSSSHGNLGPPFAGLASAAVHRWHLLDLISFAVVVLAGCVAWMRTREPALRLVVLGFAGWRSCSVPTSGPDPLTSGACCCL